MINFTYEGTASVERNKRLIAVTVREPIWNRERQHTAWQGMVQRQRRGTHLEQIMSSHFRQRFLWTMRLNWTEHLLQFFTGPNVNKCVAIVWSVVTRLRDLRCEIHTITNQKQYLQICGEKKFYFTTLNTL